MIFLTIKRVFLIVLDSVGAGALPDAAQYGDAGANTLGHILEQTHIPLPNLQRMGLGGIPGIPCPIPDDAAGAYGRAIERSAGKDTTTGHWEMAGVRLTRPFPTYPDGFPPDVIDAFEKAIGRKILCNKPISGTDVLDELGEEHIRTGCPIVYTSADSVFQIACNEDIVPLATLYDWCEKARAILTGEHGVGRVIARPFVGEKRGSFIRTTGRRDFSLPPTGDTILDVLARNGIFTMGIGKIEDIFCHRGLAKSVHSAGNPACVATLLETMREDFTWLVFVNLVDFDSVYGHRRNVTTYARALAEFDQNLDQIKALMHTSDLLLLTADHGCDPTYPGTDHTREYAPILAWRPGIAGLRDLGTRGSYADVAATVAEAFGLAQRFEATSFYDQLI